LSIYKRASGRWAVLVDLETGAGGRRRRSLGTFVTKKEAERAEREALSTRDRGIDLAPRTVTLRDVLERYLADRKQHCGAKTLERYRQIADAYILPHLGGIPITKLRPVTISAWTTTLLVQGGARDRPLAPKSVFHAHALAKAAVAWAVDMQIAVSNSFAVSKPPRVQRAQVQALSTSDAAKLMSTVRGSRWENLIHFALATGARRGEIAALRWDNVDFARGLVMISASLSQTRSGVIVKPTRSCPSTWCMSAPGEVVA